MVQRSFTSESLRCVIQYQFVKLSEVDQSFFLSPQADWFFATRASSPHTSISFSAAVGGGTICRNVVTRREVECEIAVGIEAVDSGRR